jgi:hypothetical protein
MPLKWPAWIDISVPAVIRVGACAPSGSPVSVAAPPSELLASLTTRVRSARSSVSPLSKLRFRYSPLPPVRSLYSATMATCGACVGSCSLKETK